MTDLTIYTLVDARHLEPGQIIDTEHEGQLVVDELRRRNGSVEVYGFRVGSDSKRRVVVTYEVPGNEVSVVPTERTADDLWAEVVQAVDTAVAAVDQERNRAVALGEDRPPAAPWRTMGTGTLIITIAGTDYWMEPASLTEPKPDGDPPADA